MNPIYYGFACNMNGYLAHRSDIFLTPARSEILRTIHKISARIIF